MKQSLAFIPTIQQVPTSSLDKTNQLLIRAGYIRMNESGDITYLPLAKRVLSKIEKILREEIERIPAIELSLPLIYSKNSFQSEGVAHSTELFQLKDQQGNALCLSSSHEEFLAAIVKQEIHHHQQLPFVLYQIQTKFRDEVNQKGLFKSREFMTTDVYSFHDTEEDLEETYEKMTQAFSTILSKLGLSYKLLLADAGNYSGVMTHEFVILSEHGGDVTIAYSDSSNYAVNIEMVEVIESHEPATGVIKELTKQSIPSDIDVMEGIKALTDNVSIIINTKVYDIDGELVVVLVRGDHQINEVKLKNVLKVNHLTLASEEAIQNIMGCSIHSVGPIKLPISVRVIADHAIKTIRNGLSGANEDGFYYINVNPERDFAINAYEDIRFAVEGDPSPDGKGLIQFTKGYEVGHIFKLGSTISEKLDATFTDQFGDVHPVLMGVYAMGVSRLFAVVSEQYQDDKGFAWPKQLTPFHIHLIPERSEDDVQLELAELLNNILTSYHYDVLFDDRKVDLEVKLNDAELIGLPVRVIVGRKSTDGIVEVQVRRTGETFEYAKEELVDHLNEFFRVYS
nr:proline--tRNA ligase [Lysinibacillus timonensis]